ncbi:hypothetical protein B7P43_G01151, partial [Cryptotermes secundus]
MAAAFDEYYEGSRIFTWVSDLSGLPLDQVNFVISQVLALACAPVFRNTLHPSTTSPATRHAFGLVLGLAFGYFCFGMQAVHLGGLPALCYVVMRTQDPHIMQSVKLLTNLMEQEQAYQWTWSNNSIVGYFLDSNDVSTEAEES